MALVDLYNKQGIAVTPISHFPASFTISTGATLNAVGESIGFVGPVYLSSGPGTSKTISSAGGKIWLNCTGVTWASAGTTLRVGIQDIDTSTGIEDGTYDVFDDLVQGTDTLAVGVKEVIMSSGTKTITHGDIIALVAEMTVRNGTDALNISRIVVVNVTPYNTVDTGGGPIKGNGAPFCVIQFDDGTIGHFGDWTILQTETNQTFNSGTTPDEYAMVFRVPFKCAINALLGKIAGLTTGENGTVHLIQDPFGANTNLATVALIPEHANSTGTPDYYIPLLITETTLTINTDYAISYRPTTTGGRAIKLLTFSDSSHLAGLPIQVSGASRTDLGSWTPSSTVVPDFGFRVSKLDDGVGGSSSFVEKSFAL